MQLSIGHCIQHWSSLQPDDAAIVDGKGSLSWSELDRSTNQLALEYADRGVNAGDFVSLILPNGRELYQASIAAWKLGATPQPISSRMPDLEKSALLDVVRPKLIVGEAPASCLDIQNIPEGFRPRLQTPCDAFDYPAPLHWKALASGGSTGRPKVIVSRDEGCFDPSAPDFNMTVRGTLLVAGPLYHNAPFMFSSRGLFCGNKLVVMERFDAERALALIEEHQVTWTVMVPTMMHRIWQLPPSVRESYNVCSLGTILHTASPCPPWLKANWIEWLGPKAVQEVYGGTEACGGTWISGEEWLERPGSVGRPMPGCGVKILNEAGAALPAGTVGEVFMRPEGGAGSTYFYLGADPKRDDEGWESIGDMGHLDDEGYLFLADRRTDLIISGGSNVYPAEVEGAIDAFPGVRSTAVVGLPDEDLGQRVHAIIDAPSGADEESLRAHLAERLARYKIPRSFEFVQSPLRDEAGKVRRAALRAERIASITPPASTQGAST